MIKKKLVVFSILSSSIVASCIGEVPVFAANPSPSTVQVEYKTTTTVAGTDYAVAIPQAIEFTSNNRTVSANVTLENPNGTAYTGGAIKVDGTVSSKNGYKLNLKDSSDPLAYTLTYNKQVMKSNTENQSIGQLTNDNPTLQGTAELPKSSQASKNGDHTDTLTYTFSQSSK